MDSLPLPVPAARSRGRSCGLRRLRRLLALLASWQRRCATRRQLQRLDERALADLGLNLADQCHEGGKPFWRE
ncbi:MAG: DUF1127 domain-containing protein [Pseudomonas oryzihabitans]